MHPIILHSIALKDLKFAQFVKIVDFVTFAVNLHPNILHHTSLSDFFCNFWSKSLFFSFSLGSFDPPLHYAITLSTFLCFCLYVLFFLCQNCRFRHFCRGLWTLSCLMPLHLTIVFATLVEIIIVVRLVDNVELFLTFLNLVIECNPEHFSYPKTLTSCFLLQPK